jgi:hypothetical protein
MDPESIKVIGIVLIIFLAGFAALLAFRWGFQGKRKGRHLAAIIVGGLFLAMSISQINFPSLLFFLAALASILLAAATWYALAYFFSERKSLNDLLIASICAVVGPIILLITNGPGRTYYYKVIYGGIFEDPRVRQGVSGKGLFYTSFAGLAGLIFWGWKIASSKGWNILKYSAIVVALILGLLLLIMLVSSLSL